MARERELARLNQFPSKGHLPQARAHVDEITAHLDAGGTLEVAWEPFHIYLTCFRVPGAGRNDRATRLLATAYDRLQDQAAHTGDADMRRSFLENGPAHREIVGEFARRQKIGHD